MKILLLDGSPKVKGSASAFLLKALETRLGDGHTVTWQDARKPGTEALAAGLVQADALVVAFPLYVDSIPSHLLQVLEAIQPRLTGKGATTKVYGIVNCGFYDARQNHIALAMLRLWAETCGLTWACGLGIGGGGMAQVAPLGTGPVTSFGKSMDALAGRILAGEAGDDLYAEPNFPRFLYKTMAHIGWRSQAKKNGISPKGMKRRIAL